MGVGESHAGSRVGTRNAYRAWPRYQVGLEDLDWKNGRIVALAEGVLGLLLFIPAFQIATGVRGNAAAFLIVAHIASFAIVGGPLHRYAQTSRRIFDLQIAVSLVANVTILTGFVLLSGNPKSGLWLCLLVYAAVLGSSQEAEPCITYLVALVATPLLTIPYFALASHDLSSSWAGPVWAAWMNGLTYHGLATVSAKWREKRHELQSRIAELERNQLARELHDSVGSTLALLGMYGDLIESYLDRPEQLRDVAAELKSAAREGLDELRGVIDALAPEAASFGSLAASVSRVVERASLAAAVPIRFDATGEKDAHISGPVRLAIVRVLQEALSNAMRHGRPRAMSATLAFTETGLAMRVGDDGSGFDSSRPASGRGLASMKLRAREVGGHLEIDTRPGHGTTLTMEVPHSSLRRAAS